MKRQYIASANLVFLIGVFLNVLPAKGQETPSVEGLGSYRISGENQEMVIIPFEMHRGKPLMELEINGQKATLMIDNGVLWDEVWLFGSPLVNDLNLLPGEKYSLEESDSNSPSSMYSSENLTLSFKDIVFSEQPVLISPPAAGYADMFPFADGQICNTFFKNFIVEFDFIRNEIILHNPNVYSYTGSGSVLEMQLTESGSYSVPFTIETHEGIVYTDRVNLDLGGIYALKISLNTKHDIEPPAGSNSRSCFGGTEYFANLKSMSIGDYTLEEPFVAYGDEKTYRVYPENLGMIGLPLFKKFNVIFDYFGKKLFIEPSENFKKGD